MRASTFGVAGVMQQGLVMLLGMCLMCSGCTAPRAMALDPPPVVPAKELGAGRPVTVVLRDGTRIKGWIVAARADGLTVNPGSYGTERDVAFREMKSLHVRGPSKGRTIAAAIGGAALAVLGVLYLVAMERASHDD